MPKPTAEIAESVASRARSVDRFVTRMERLSSEGRVSPADLARVYSGAYLGYYTFLERSLERAFLGLIMGRYEHGDRRVRPLVSIKSDAVAQRVIAGGRAYADWIPYRLTISRAETFLSAGRPFADVSKADVAVLEQLATMRNAIAHDSAFSIRRFREVFVAGKALRASELTPPGYLRGKHAIDQTRLNFLFSQGLGVIHRLLG